MKKNKVISQLAFFSGKELRQFGKFIELQRKPPITKLYKFIAKHHPVFDDKKFTRTNCLLYIYPELKPKLAQQNGQAEKFISNKLKNPLYDLKMLIDEFIIQQELEATSHEKTMLLINGLFKRGMNEKAFQLIDKELKRLESKVGKNIYHHFYQFQLIEKKQDNAKDRVKLAPIFIKDMLEKLDLFFAHAKLRFGAESLTREALFGDNNEILFFKELCKLTENYPSFSKNATLMMYAKITKLNKKSSFQDYLQVKELFFHKIDEILEEDRKDLLIYLYNYCNLIYKVGKSNYLTEMFELSNFGLENNLLIEHGYILNTDFKNIVTVSVTLKKYDWVTNFIETNAYLIAPDYRENIVLLCTAQVEKNKGNLEKVIELLKDVEFKNVFDNLTARSLMMWTYFESEEWHTLDFYLESFIKFVKRNNNISSEMQLSFLNMIKFTKKLIAARFQKASKEELLKKLEELSPIYSKSWLVEQIDHIAGN